MQRIKHSLSELQLRRWRKDKRLKEEDMKYHVVEIAGLRLYVVEFPMSKMVSP